MSRYRTIAAVVAALAALSCGAARADTQAPRAGAVCPADLADVMTLLPDGQTYAICQQSGPDSFGWAPVQTPFEPNDTWLSYGPVITLHGQGMRNPNLTSGNWTATPREPEAACRAEEQTVVEAGVLSAPEVFQGEAGKPMTLPMLPKLFYLQLSGHCLWGKN
ncbi:hypothetical protein [Mycolicibacterium sp.]|uniref:hypothetical protein n=1 Tax=Mycolicibacterium sp. TaxID=2320850 RepID=UPI0025F22961|nr:hypothetical protein [Mycolicibacterium sp.]